MDNDDPRIPLPPPLGSDVLAPPPTSIEEAGALLGAAITRYSAESLTSARGSGSVVAPPAGVHSSFATISPSPGSELYVRLASLRSFLRERAGLGPSGQRGHDDNGDFGDQVEKKKSETTCPLSAAPALLAVCMKIFQLSPVVSGTPPVVVATSGNGGGGIGVGGGKDARHGSVKVPVRLAPPMLSTPLRSAWVDCVVLCHRLGANVPMGAGGGMVGRGGGKKGSSATGGGAAPGGVDAMGFLRRMMEAAATNPRSAKAAGGTRIAALEAIVGLFSDPIVLPRVVFWSHNVLDLCKRSLRSSGSGEPHYRLAAMEAACAIVQGSRRATVANAEKREEITGQKDEMVGIFVIRGGLEDRTILETAKLAVRASDDRYPEVREATARFAGLASSMLILSHPAPGTASSSSSGNGGQQASLLANLDEMMQLCLNNLDDESAAVAASWAEALARCVCASIEYGESYSSLAITLSHTYPNFEHSDLYNWKSHRR